MLAKYKNTLLLHLIVFIWGFTGILGALITIPSQNLVWYRMLIAFTAIFIYIKLVKIPLRLDAKSLVKFLGTGIIISLHWIFFFEAIKVSNISVTLACLSSATLFTALLEPLFYKRKLVAYEIILGIIVIVGLFLIFKFESKYQLGILYTLFSSFMASLFTVINGRFANKYNSGQVAFYEMLGGFGSITVYFLFTSALGLSLLNVGFYDWVYLILLGTICTAFAFIASISIMKELTPYTVTMTTNLEPVYGIIMAFLFFGSKEKMSTEFYLGTIIILGSIFIDGYFKSRKKAIKEA